MTFKKHVHACLKYVNTMWLQFDKLIILSNNKHTDVKKKIILFKIKHNILDYNSFIKHDTVMKFRYNPDKIEHVMILF